MRRTRDEMRADFGRRRVESHRVAFVPTMGAFHAGHLSLIRAARAAADFVVVSIFVNPRQFGPSEDFDSYPRDERADLEAAEAEGVDVVFAPAVEEMYPVGAVTAVSVGRLATVLEGAARPGHFDGVCTVVAVLLNVVRPDVAFFGQKDAQQVAVIRRMVGDLGWPTEIAVCPTQRAPDGLALSSRNAYLSPQERARAGALYRALEAGRSALEAGHVLDRVEAEMSAVLQAEPGVEQDYARAVDPDKFEAPAPGAPVVLVTAARIGETRLIDSLPVGRRR